MPRGRPKKNPAAITNQHPTSQESLPNQEIDQEMINFATNFAKSLNAASNIPVFYNPIWQNTILKDLNMSPSFFDREKIEELISNPKDNEDALKDLAQYLMNVILQFNHVVRYYSDIPTFDHLIIPTNADEEDMKSASFSKSRKKAVDWLNKLNPKSTFPSILEGTILEDAKFYYVRESEDSVTLQEMPAKYCKIISKTEYGYQYAFNMYYFLRAGVNIHDFHPDFVDFFNNFLEDNKNNDQYFYWQRLDPVKAPVFKFDETKAGLTPPLMGLFLDSAEIANYKKLLKTKTQLDIVKLLINKIPLHTETKGAQTKNNFAIDPDTAGKFTAMMQSGLPEGYKAVTSPLEVQPIDFKDAQSRDNIVGYAQDNFYHSAGVSPVMFGDKNVNGTGLEASKKVDEAYVLHMYRQFERFINMWMKSKTGKYRFKVYFPDITIFNQKEKIEMFLKTAQFGTAKSPLFCAMGFNPDDMESLIAYENAVGLVQTMVPLQSSHTQNQNGEPGAPQKDVNELTGSGVKARDLGTNPT